MSEISAALQFFQGFGENWHALEECLQYLDEWIPADAYVLVVERAEDLLAEEELGEMCALLRVLDSAGDHWAKPVVDNDRFNRGARPFHVVLHLSDSECSDDRIVTAAQRSGVDLRRD